jgi:ribosomal protein S12 methylthiotransferase
MDIPVQHISDRILSKMNRHGNQALIKDTISKLRREVPEITLRTTVIVGFPSESEKDFEELCNFISETKFDRFGAFTYSPEEDTPAATFDDQIDEQVKQDRYDTIMQIQLDISEKNNRKKVGKIIPVLCEGFDPVSEAHYGRSQADAPDVDGKIYFTADKRVEEGAFVYVRIEETLDYDLVGKKVNYVRNGDKRK